jgi:cold shock CspA family protein/ribosome-associated translation inhibitor RaiA
MRGEETNVEIHWTHIAEVAEGVRADAERRLQALAGDHTDLIDLRITGSETRHHRHGAREVRIRCQARGRELVVTRECAELGLALNEALDAFEREVHRLRSQQRDRRSERLPLPPYLGVVDRIFRTEGYGFVLTDSGEQVYFHRNALSGLDFDRLQEGNRVGLNIEAGERGPQATVVHAPPPDAPSP